MLCQQLGINFKTTLLTVSHRYLIFPIALLARSNLQCQHLIPALKAWAEHNSRPHCPVAIQFPVHGCIDDRPTERSVDSQATLVIDVLGIFLTCYSWVFCTTRLWQTSGPLVKEINVCTATICRLKSHIAFNFSTSLSFSRRRCFRAIGTRYSKLCNQNYQ